MTKIWNNPANWPPVPEGWTPPEEGWIPPEGWTPEGYPTHPEGWEFWIEDEPVISRFSLPPLPPLPSFKSQPLVAREFPFLDTQDGEERSYHYGACSCGESRNIIQVDVLDFSSKHKLSATQVALKPLIDEVMKDDTLTLVKKSLLMSKDSKDKIVDHIAMLESGYLESLNLLKVIIQERNLAMQRVTEYEENVRMHEQIVKITGITNLDLIIVSKKDHIKMLEREGKEALAAKTIELELLHVAHTEKLSEEARVQKFTLSRKEKQLAELEVKIAETDEEVKSSSHIMEYKGAFLNKYYNIAETSIELGSELSLIKSQCKSMVRGKTSITKPDVLNKFSRDFANLMLKAYNSEAENAIVKAADTKFVLNASRRIDEAFLSLNTLGQDLSIEISEEYHQLRKQEIELTFKYKDKKEQERVNANERRAQQREDEAVEKEISKKMSSIESEKQKLENDERAVEEARALVLEKEKKEAAHAFTMEVKKRNTENSTDNSSQPTGKKEKLSPLEEERKHYTNVVAHASPELDKLDKELKKIHDKIAELDKAAAEGKDRLANKKAGYVYVISNIGAFGEGVVKIGLTRRLDPFDRVRELSSASVPFVFDVHTMHFSLDAVALEGALHKQFLHKAVNKSNLKKEFFRVNPTEVKDFLETLQDGVNMEFDTDYQATDYYKTISINTGVDFHIKEPVRTVVDVNKKSHKRTTQIVAGWGPRIP